jgi:hypothetical protein
MAINCVASPGYVVLSQLEVRTLLAGGMACYPAAGPPWTNQEYHTGVLTGTVTDYKKGPPAPGNKDPSKQVGTYGITATGTGGVITYTYNGGSTFAYKVWGTQTGGSGIYDFCNVITPTTPLPGQVMVIVSTGAPTPC